VAAEHFNKHIDEVNKKHEGNHDWSNENYANPSQSKDPAFRAYMKDIDKLTQDSIVHASNKLYLKNPSGTKEVEISSSHVGSYNLHVKEVAHATSDQALNIQVKFQHDDQGYVTGFEFDDAEDLKDGGADEATEMAQSAIQNGSEFVIEHFGVKGMRWGVRKAEYHEAEAAKHVAQGKKKAAAHLLKTGNREEAKAIQDGHMKKAKEHLAQAKEIRAKYAPVEPKATSKIRSGWSKKTQIETDGGENHPAHPDALKVASARAKLKKSGTSALSNQELRDVSTRVLLENQAELLTSHKGKKFVARQLSDTGNTLARAVERGNHGTVQYSHTDVLRTVP
jgi:hypothetical protein